MYASTLTTSPSEAFYEWKAETSSSTRVFIKPTNPGVERTKRNTEINNINQTTIPVYMALTGLEENNVIVLESGELPCVIISLVEASNTSVTHTDARREVGAIILSVVAALVAAVFIIN